MTTRSPHCSSPDEEYYIADHIKLKKPPPGSKIEALRDTIEQRVSANSRAAPRGQKVLHN